VTPLADGTTTCDGTYGGTGANVNVPDGAICVLTAGTTVTHDVRVAAGGTLIDPTVTIKHDLVAQSPVGIVISGDSIGHDLRIEGLSGSATQAGNSVCSTEVGHDLVIDGGLDSAGAFLIGSCPNGGNTVGHDLVVSDNVNAIVVDLNSVGHDLVVTGDTNAVVGTGNTVGHDLRVDGAPHPNPPKPESKAKSVPADRPPPPPRPQTTNAV
jgi:hypothetical protein